MMSLEKLCRYQAPPIRPTQKTETKTQHEDILSQKRGSVAAFLRSLRANAVREKKLP